ncbi:MAG: tRNA(Met) cytidine acetyltransferase [Crenarchaeota archaeon]|nr:tRNA(Met) cytidine acetyltransferase [Thermoproteota archaeon]
MKCYWRRLRVASEGLLARLKGRVLFVSERRPPYPWRRLPPSAYRRVLGTEWDHVVIDLTSPVPANAFPATIETVRGGGTVALIKERDLEEVYSASGTGLFGRYLEEAIGLYSEGGQCPKWEPPKGLTKEQRRALKALNGFVVGSSKALAVLGDRGRGKSALLGAMAATLVLDYGVRRVEVTSPSPEMPSFMKLFDMIMNERRARYRLERAGDSWRILGPGWRVEWVPPPRAGGKAGVVMVDEAAAVGVATVRRILNKSWKTVLSTTVHGYEGSGRALTKLLLESIKDVKVIELKEPVRYPPGDPVERWLYEAFHLDAEPGDTEPSGPPREVDRASVASPGAARPYAALLALAHYRWEPSDVELVLQHPKGRLWEYPGTGGPAGVAFTVDEEPPEDPWRPAPGAALSRIISRYEPAPARRVVRIAVHPRLQRRGIGSALLKALESGITGAVFSRHEVLDFWLKNGYKVIYLSPRYNRVTGEKNVAVAKGGSAVSKAARAFARSFLLSAHAVYRDVDVRKAFKMLAHSEPEPVELSCEEVLIEKFLEGAVEAETAFPALYCCALKRVWELGPEKGALAFGYLIQGKGVWDLAASFEASPDEVEELLREALLDLARACV